MGLWFVLFLMEHLLTNSQAALWLGDNGKGFVALVNLYHNLPYVEVIELTLIGVPILLHAILGIKYLLTGKFIYGRSDGSTPVISSPRNRAYNWQRITSWALLFFIVFHVVKFRFLEYPDKVLVGNETHYAVTVTPDDGLYKVADRLGVVLSDLKQGELLAVSKDFGTATLMSVRDTFKNPYYIGLYTLFVLAACFHACNGFWTFLITWGWILKMSAQRAWTTVAVVLMVVLIFLGLAAVWGTYWANLRY
jgi:succinate dehydrogenase / fumarate reductase, cytochrome b subunit